VSSSASASVIRPTSRAVASATARLPLVERSPEDRSTFGEAGDLIVGEHDTRRLIRVRRDGSKSVLAGRLSKPYSLVTAPTETSTSLKWASSPSPPES
jgi:hypothetical protein